MSVYKKLQQARLNIVNTTLKKSGKNKFVGYEYFELGDFIPTVHSVFNDVGLCGVFTLSDTNAHLTIHDTDGDSAISFSSPLVMAEGQKQQAIQLLGSTHSYLRRYLWLMALELVESDGVDSLPPVEKPKKLDNFTVDPSSLQIVQKRIDKVKTIEPKAVDVSNVIPIVDMDELTVVSDWVTEFGSSCTSKAELVQFWNLHKPKLKEMEILAPSMYEELVAKYKQYKENLTKE